MTLSVGTPAHLHKIKLLDKYVDDEGSQLASLSLKFRVYVNCFTFFVQNRVRFEFSHVLRASKHSLCALCPHCGQMALERVCGKDEAFELQHGLVASQVRDSIRLM